MVEINHEVLHHTSDALCFPLVLIINFSLFQYLVTTFYARRAETRVRMLFVVAFLSFASIVPFSYPDAELVHDLSDISEVSTVMTFLLQINILARRVSKKIKIRSLVVCAWIGELLVMLGFVVLILNIAQVVDDSVGTVAIEELDDVYENVATTFVCVFRFYFLGMVKGYKVLWRSHKFEMFSYFLFLTHEYPFMALNAATDVSWEHVQGLWNRLVIVLCLSSTLKAKFLASSGSSKAKKSAVGVVSSRASSNARESTAPGPAKVSATAKHIRTLKAVSVLPLGPSSFTTRKA
ncbi:hypothetical protein PybrP1_012162 [[Pythium] brassicae (nom. inval.)]|nr:hypothetical protein PybrP1_012162 [[Pythium] brassicae (nom. inval.)]